MRQVTEVRSHEDLEVWKLGMSLAADCYEVTKSFPREEAFGQTAQVRRASISIPANIAEGYGRESTAPFIHFLRVTQGSQKELETHVLLSQQVGLMTGANASPLLEKVESVGRMPRNLIRSLEAKLDDR